MFGRVFEWTARTCCVLITVRQGAGERGGCVETFAAPPPSDEKAGGERKPKRNALAWPMDASGDSRVLHRGPTQLFQHRVWRGGLDCARRGGADGGEGLPQRLSLLSLSLLLLPSSLAAPQQVVHTTRHRNTTINIDTKTCSFEQTLSPLCPTSARDSEDRGLSDRVLSFAFPNPRFARARALFLPPAPAPAWEWTVLRPPSAARAPPQSKTKKHERAAAARAARARRRRVDLACAASRSLRARSSSLPRGDGLLRARHVPAGVLHQRPAAALRQQPDVAGHRGASFNLLFLPCVFPCRSPPVAAAHAPPSQKQKNDNQNPKKPQLPFEHYSMPFCKPEEGVKRIGNTANLGTILSGLRIENSPYQFHMMVREGEGGRGRRFFRGGRGGGGTRVAPGGFAFRGGPNGAAARPLFDEQSDTTAAQLLSRSQQTDPSLTHQ
jgi:hypothetical protein